MMEKILWMRRVNKEVVATPSTGAGTHGKGSIPSAQADRSDLNSTSIKPAVLLLLLFIIFLTFKTKKLWDSNGNKTLSLSMTKELFQGKDCSYLMGLPR